MADPSSDPDSKSDTGDDTGFGPGRSPTAVYPGTPRWVKVFGIIALLLVLLVVIALLTGVGGEHGPGRHIPSGGADGHAPPIPRGP